jgi:hypothetical protein
VRPRWNSLASMRVKDAPTIFVKAQTVIRTRDGVVDERSSLKRRKSMRTPPAESDQMTGLITKNDHGPVKDGASKDSAFDLIGPSNCVPSIRQISHAPPNPFSTRQPVRPDTTLFDAILILAENSSCTKRNIFLHKRACRATRVPVSEGDLACDPPQRR